VCWPFSSGGLEITREITIGQHEDYLCVRVIVGLLTVPVVVPATSRKARCKNLARMLDGLVACAVDQRRWDRALRLAAAASVLRAKLGSRLPPSRLATLERMLLAARDHVGAAAAATIWMEGMTMDMRELMAHVGGERA
jgi:hypothetical protein